MEVGQSHAFLSEPVNFGRPEVWISKATDSFVSHVINHDDDKVWSKFSVGPGKATRQ